MYRAVAMAGSPPPMRGKATGIDEVGVLRALAPAHAGKGDRYARATRAIGITPAHAGKGANGNGGLQDDKDHPRPCGEKYGCSVTRPDAPGSPPPMRGKVAALKGGN